MKHLLKLSALTPKEILHILDVADEYKRLHCWWWCLCW